VLFGVGVWSVRFVNNVWLRVHFCKCGVTR
jgi:hypothetical protein